MSLVVVERSFEQEETFAELEARELAAKTCLETYRVVPRISYFSRDRRQMICLYDAPEADAVRATQRASGLSYLHLWTATEIVSPHLTDPSPRTAVVCPRAFPRPVTTSEVHQMMARTQGCSDIYRVDPLGTLLSADGSRGLCLYAAPDAESIRSFNDRFQLPAERVFAASVHFPSEAS